MTSSGRGNLEMGAADEGGPYMSILDHLRDLRGRLFKAVLALVVAAVLTSLFAGEIIKFLIQPYGGKLQTLGPTENVVSYFRVALLSGATLAMPVIVYQLLAFVVPGLTRA
jgi:sec-independent protein translocase protein TatC